MKGHKPHFWFHAGKWNCVVPCLLPKMAIGRCWTLQCAWTLMHLNNGLYCAP